MSALETIRATSLANSAAVIEHCKAGLLEGNHGTADEQAAAATVVECLLAAVQRILAVPIEIQVAWPSGLHKHTRDTLRAQLQHEINQAAIRRAQDEFRHVVAVAPELARAIGAWCIALSK